MLENILDSIAHMENKRKADVVKRYFPVMLACHQRGTRGCE